MLTGSWKLLSRIESMRLVGAFCFSAKSLRALSFAAGTISSPAKTEPPQGGAALRKAAAGPKKQSRRYPCESCGSTFADRKGLITHQRIHTGEKPFVCSECSKAFSDRSSLASHVRQHTGEKPFQERLGSLRFACLTNPTPLVRPSMQCSQCGRAFACLSNLRRHFHLHTGLRPHFCTHAGCGKVSLCKAYHVSLALAG